MNSPATPISQLRNLGPVSARQLARIKVTNLFELNKKGAMNCFIELSQLEDYQPGLNFLYAMLGALENKHWTEYKKRKGELLIELESQREFLDLMQNNT
ncbi:TfoX/Sxy family DNA transformation protein [Aliikangiella coralliicola]|uniref:Competence-specific regulator n=1 Tax=Aliikangiella coralliicola TaxID=2592383 RepID=A0A545U720_9GAMM|nr:TfoX/Sxy family DNA transformation protein [Aliikangiella coralliicola]TQV85278.1 competence-specific regulator [Aliikangiella coralliicola]